MALLAWGGTFVCLASLAIAYFFFQLYLGLEPCPLCILDRWIIAALTCGFLCLAISKKTVARSIALLWNSIFLPAAFVVGGRHLWLEANPLPLDESADCAPGGRSQQLLEWLTTAFTGTSDCATAPWHLLGLSIAGWTMLLFVALSVLHLLTVFTYCKDMGWLSKRP